MDVVSADKWNQSINRLAS